MPVKVFAEDFIEKLRERCAATPDDEWSSLEKIALHRHRADVREEIERLVSRLHRTDQERVIRDLRQGVRLRHTFNELLIASVLLDHGYVARYEQPFQTANGTVTPDWFVKGEQIEFICDVFTCGFTAEVEVREASYEDITKRLQKLHRPFDLIIRADDVLLSTTDTERSELVEAVDRWLTLHSSSLFDWKGIAIRILGKRSAGPVSVSIEEPLHLVQTPRSIRRNVVEKTRKYGKLAIPFVVAAVVDPRSDVNYVDFEDTILGKAVHVSVPDAKSGRTLWSGEIREDGGVFHTQPSLAAALWLRRVDAGHYEFISIVNNVNGSLPVDAFRDRSNRKRKDQLVAWRTADAIQQKIAVYVDRTRGATDGDVKKQRYTALQLPALPLSMSDTEFAFLTPRGDVLGVDRNSGAVRWVTSERERARLLAPAAADDDRLRCLLPPRPTNPDPCSVCGCLPDRADGRCANCGGLGWIPTDRTSGVGADCEAEGAPQAD